MRCREVYVRSVDDHAVVGQLGVDPVGELAVLFCAFCVSRDEAFLARVSVCGMSAFLVGSCVWVIDRGPGPKNLFHTGAIDIAALVMMGAAVAVGYRAAQRARHGGLVLSRR